MGGLGMMNNLIQLKKMSKEQIDILLNKWISRKLMVFIVACIGLFAGNLDSNDWVIIATAYIGIEGATNIVERLMKAKVNRDEN
jgi:hypothetical protein